MSKFSQSVNNFYSTVSQNRPGTTAGKNPRGRISSTGESFLPNNTVSNFRPATGLMVRSSSSSFRNTKGKLQTLGDSLTVLLDECKETRTDTRELQLRLNFLKDQLNGRGIEPLKVGLVQEIKLLEKSITISRRSDMLRFEALHQTCQALNRNTKDIRGRLNALNERLHEVENVLGYHGLRDKLKY